jgi:hypothetical protein
MPVSRYSGCLISLHNGHSIDGHCRTSNWNFNEFCTTYMFLSVLFSFLFPATNLIHNIQIYWHLLYSFAYTHTHTHTHTHICWSKVEVLH